MNFYITDLQSITIPIIIIIIGLFISITSILVDFYLKKSKFKRSNFNSKKNNIFSFIKSNLFIFFALFGFLLCIAGIITITKWRL